jgi:L-asparaginase II
MVRGAVDHPVFMRSCAKPFQGLSVVESGAADAYGFSADEIAVICGSHPGEPEHVRAASSILKKAKLTVGHLQCGAPPAQRIARPARPPQVGEGAHRHPQQLLGEALGMVSATKFMRAPLDTYLQPTHPLQKRNRANRRAVRRAEAGVDRDRHRRMQRADVRTAAPRDGAGDRVVLLHARNSPAGARRHDGPSGDGRTPVRDADVRRARPPARQGRRRGRLPVRLPGKKAGLALKVEDGNARAWVHVLHA